MKILQEMDHFYYKMALFELQAMNEDDYYQGLSYHSMLYINVISQLKQCTLSKLSELLCVTKSAVTLKINELVKAGAVEKVQSEDDKRVFYVRLAPNMSETIQIYDTVIGNIEEQLYEQYTKEELQTFAKVLHTIAGYEWRKMKDES